MRSDLVFSAMTNVSNRYLLTILASKAARAMHRPGVRMEDTANDVFARLSRHNPIACEQTLRDPLVVPLRTRIELPVTRRKSTVVMPSLPSERSNAFWDASRPL
jgi:hypothetical protein